MLNEEPNYILASYSPSSVAGDTSPDSFVVGMDATHQGDWVLDERAVGVYCHTDYVFEVRLDGFARVIKTIPIEPVNEESPSPNAAEEEWWYNYEVVPLTGWLQHDAIVPGVATNHLKASCIGSGPTLTLWVNGELVLQAEGR